MAKHIELSRKDVFVQARIPASLRARLERRARQQGMTLSRYLREIIDRAVNLPRQPVQDDDLS
jgi:predicted DNA binding CopG/RHH family protein